MGMIPRCEAGHNSVNFYHPIQHKSYHKYILWYYLIVAKRIADGVWLSLVERYVRDVEVASSNLVTPIITESLYLQALERKKEHFKIKLRCSFLCHLTNI